MLRRAATVLAAALCVLVAARARAQVSEGRRHLDDADFAAAIAAFDAAEQGPLTRDAYVSLLEGRALARWATSDEAHAREDLAALVEIDPSHAFPPEAPPELGELFRHGAEARSGPLAADAAFAADGALEVDVLNDNARVARTLRVHLRTGSEAWRTVELPGPSARVPAGPADARVEAWIEVLGPGAAVLTTTASAAEPIVRAPAAHPHGDDSALWIGLGIGAGVLVAAVVVILIAVATSGPSDATQPTGPMVIGF